MDEGWFVYRLKKQTGPYTLRQLQELIRQDQLGPEDLLSKRGFDRWKKAAEIPGLFANHLQGSPPNLSNEPGPSKNSEVLNHTEKSVIRPRPAQPAKKSGLGLAGYLGIGCGVLALAAMCVVILLLLVPNRNPAADGKSFGTFVVEPSGGKFENNELMISIPAGAAKEKLTFNVVRNDTPPAEEEGVTYRSAGYQITGPIKSLDGDLEISLELPDSALSKKENDVFLVLEEQVMSRGGGETTGFYLLPSSVDAASKRVTATLKLISQDAVGYVPRRDGGHAALLARLPGQQEEPPTDTTLTIRAENGWFYDMYSSEHFLVSYRGKLVNAAAVKELVKILEDQRQKIIDFGFSFGNVEKTEINLMTLNQEPGKFMTSEWGGSYCTIQISNQYFYTYDLFTENYQNVLATAGHELLHLAQYMMDPRYAYTKAKASGAVATLWMDEAASTWYETLASGNPDYVPNNAEKFRFFFQTPLMGASIEKSQDHGYGASSFLRFLTQKYNDKLVVEIYKQLQKGTTTSTAAEALYNALDTYGTSPGIEWTPFLETFFTATDRIYVGMKIQVPKTVKLVANQLPDSSDYQVNFQSHADLAKIKTSETIGHLSTRVSPSVTYTFHQSGLTADAFLLGLAQVNTAQVPFESPGQIVVAVDAPENTGVLVYGYPLGGGVPVPLAGAPYQYLSSGDPFSTTGSRLMIDLGSPDEMGNLYENILFIPFNNRSGYTKPKEMQDITIQLTYLLQPVMQPTKTLPPIENPTETPTVTPTVPLPPEGESSHVCAGMTVPKLKAPLGHVTKCWLTCFGIQSAAPSDGEIQACIDRFQ
jgi:hypothetical protein